jgi:hypothetical protein
MAQTDGLFAEIGHFRLIWAIAGEAEEPHQHCTHTPYIVSNLLRETIVSLHRVQFRVSSVQAGYSAT